MPSKWPFNFLVMCDCLDASERDALVRFEITLQTAHYLEFWLEDKNSNNYSHGIDIFIHMINIDREPKGTQDAVVNKTYQCYQPTWSNWHIRSTPSKNSTIPFFFFTLHWTFKKIHWILGLKSISVNLKELKIKNYASD